MSKKHKTLTKRFALVLAVLSFGLILGWGGAKKADAAQKPVLARLVNLDLIPAGLDSGPAMWTHTVYVSRIDSQRLTGAINELHALMAERGWLYLEMTPHMEDGDLKGIWVVYRAMGWAPEPESP